MLLQHEKKQNTLKLPSIYHHTQEMILRRIVTIHHLEHDWNCKHENVLFCVEQTCTNNLLEMISSEHGNGKNEEIYHFHLVTEKIYSILV